MTDRITRLRAEGLRRSFSSGSERIVPVDGIDLEVAAGEVVVLTGPSGSGKTTLLELLAGFHTPDEGRVRWFSDDLGDEVGSAGPAWSVLAVVPQSLGLLPEMTAVENVAMPMLASGGAPHDAGEAARRLLESMNASDLADRLVGAASLGQQQRVAVARALVGDPLIVLADEPTSHQDSEHAALVLAALRGSAQRGAACVLAGHDPLLLTAADRLIRLVNGRIEPE
jgi:putative ABC transport system ATP-binding protein